MFRGYTLNLSSDGAEVESKDIGATGRPELKGGDVVQFSFYYRKRGNVEAMRFSARVIYVMGQNTGLHLFVSELQHRQREDFDTILQKESDRIE